MAPGVNEYSPRWRSVFGEVDAARTEADVEFLLRELDTLPVCFDAVVNMWASFGYFEAATNEHVLASFARRLRPGGRLVLDLFDRAFFEGRAGERELRPGVVERSWVTRGRRRCEIDYGDGQVDVFEWQLYSADELEQLAGRYSLVPVERDAAPAEPSQRLVLQLDHSSSGGMRSAFARSPGGRGEDPLPG